jgi:hypothetical protein|nr:MAG TPA: hypothetical protein [Caudoviricetes sp.]
MNCMSKKVKRNKEKLIQKEYQEKLANFTPEEKQAKDDRDLAMRKKITQILGVMTALENITGNIYSDKRIWRE